MCMLHACAPARSLHDSNRERASAAKAQHSSARRCARMYAKPYSWASPTLTASSRSFSERNSRSPNAERKLSLVSRRALDARRKGSSCSSCVQQGDRSDTFSHVSRVQ